MKFLEIKDGVSIKLDSIDKVESISELQCRITCAFESYVVTLPYGILMDLLQSTQDKDLNAQLLQEISKKVGSLPIFAG